MQYRSIGVFDSGVGGLTVAKAIMEAMPGQNIIYYGDTARMPYGDKPPEEIVRYARQIIEFLVGRGVCAVAVACNTSSAIAVPIIGRDFDVPVVGMIECGAAAAAEASRSGRIGVIATANTVRSGAYSRAIKGMRPAAHVVEQACPMLVPMVERGEISGPDVRHVLSEYIQPLLEAEVDTIVYGCTHYPFLEAEVRAMAGSSVALVDPATKVASAVKAAIGEGGSGQAGLLSFVTSGDPNAFAELVSTLMGWSVHEVEHVDLDAAGAPPEEGGMLGRRDRA
ncbi:MAG: glutamate racemase [Bacillota bacterium]|jgi:glutamate racemase|nr:glutamate racemase [Bacillota bacterium]NLH87359.1 glutamate racemase [Bacillota bacterium]HAN87268.1 glutamate racemase [Bacillota bacterium]